MCVGEDQGAVSGFDVKRYVFEDEKGKIYRACVQSVLVYGSETWAFKVSDTQQLERTERMMVRWMCGVSLKDRKARRSCWIGWVLLVLRNVW